MMVNWGNFSVIDFCIRKFVTFSNCSSIERFNLNSLLNGFLYANDQSLFVLGTN